jgi:hypothetical protein
MKYLEDTLAEQCLSKPYILIRKFMFVEKLEGTLMTYTNELEVEVDFSDVDPSLLRRIEAIQIQLVSHHQLQMKLNLD